MAARTRRASWAASAWFEPRDVMARLHRRPACCVDREPPDIPTTFGVPGRIVRCVTPAATVDTVKPGASP